MRPNLKRARLHALLLCLIVNFCPTAAHAQSAAADSQKSDGGGVKMLQPSDFFRDFPAVTWGMSFSDARRAIEKAGARPVRAHEGDATELVWTGRFEGMDGRARAHFREGAGLDDVAVGVYAFERRAEVFESWLRRLTERHGKPTAEADDEVSTSKVWGLKGGFSVELRTLKDPDSPVVEIHWVKL